MYEPTVRSRCAPACAIQATTFVLAVIGRMLVNRIWRGPISGEKNYLPVEWSVGGFAWGAARQAIALGFKVMVSTLIGDDWAGKFIEDSLGEMGVDLGGVRRGSLPTPTAEVIVEDGRHTILMDENAPSPMWRLTRADYRRLATADVILAGGTLDRGGYDKNLRAILKTGRNHGIPIHLNPTRVFNPGSLDLAGVRLMQVSRADFRRFGVAWDAPDAALADLLLARGAEFVAITDGASPSRCYGQGGISAVTLPLPVARVAFPFGPGDHSFAAKAGALSVNGNKIPEWMPIGDAAGSHYVETGLPASWSDIAERLSRLKMPPEVYLG